MRKFMRIFNIASLIFLVFYLCITLFVEKSTIGAIVCVIFIIIDIIDIIIHFDDFR